jgi:hypothetical protein
VTLPAGQQVSLRARSLDLRVGASFNVVEESVGCSGFFSCVASDLSDTNFPINQDANVVLANRGASPRSYFVMVFGFRKTDSTPDAMPFLLEAEWSPLPVAVGGADTCGAPSLLDAGVAVTGWLQGASVDLAKSASCVAQYSSRDPSPDVVYAVDVPAGKMLTAKVSAFSAWSAWGDPFLWLIGDGAQACGAPASCRAASDKGQSREQVAWVNTEATTQRALLVIGSDKPPGLPEFVLETRMGPPPRGATCADPIDVTSSAVFFIGGGAGPSTLAPLCFGKLEAGHQGETVYRVRVPAGGRLDVSAMNEYPIEPVSGGVPSNPMVALIEGPASNCTPTATLLACDDHNSPFNADRLAWTNPSNVPAEVFVIVDEVGRVSPRVVGIELTP